MGAPTLVEALLDDHTCLNCGTPRPVGHYAKKARLEELLERLGRLENFARAGVPLPPED